MTPQLASIHKGSTLRSGWKFLYTGWMIIAAMLLAGFIFDLLFSGADIKSVINMFSPQWFGRVVPYIAAGLLLAVPCGFLLAAVIMAIKSMLKREGGLGLLLTTIVGTYAGFVVVTLVAWLSGIMFLGSMH